jgi:hypothetical protein
MLEFVVLCMLEFVVLCMLLTLAPGGPPEGAEDWMPGCWVCWGVLLVLWGDLHALCAGWVWNSGCTGTWAMC